MTERAATVGAGKPAPGPMSTYQYHRLYLSLKPTMTMKNGLLRICVLAGVLIAMGIVASKSARPQNGAPADPVQWGRIKADLQIGWEMPRTEFHAGEPIVLFARLRMVREGGTPVEVTSSTQLGPFSIKILYGADREPIAMTPEGLAIVSPEAFRGTRGSSMTPAHRMRWDIPLSKWWNLSRPGQYTVLVTHRQPRAGHPRQYVILEAPRLMLRVVN